MNLENACHVDPGQLVMTPDDAVIALDQYTDSGRQLLMSVRHERLWVLAGGRLVDPDAADKGAQQ